MTPAGRKYAQVNSSSRVQATRTAFPAAFARRCGIIARWSDAVRSAAFGLMTPEQIEQSMRDLAAYTIELTK